MLILLHFTKKNKTPPEQKFDTGVVTFITLNQLPKRTKAYQKEQKFDTDILRYWCCNYLAKGIIFTVLLRSTDTALPPVLQENINLTFLVCINFINYLYRIN